MQHLRLLWVFAQIWMLSQEPSDTGKIQKGVAVCWNELSLQMCCKPRHAYIHGCGLCFYKTTTLVVHPYRCLLYTRQHHYCLLELRIKVNAHGDESVDQRVQHPLIQCEGNGPPLSQR